MKNRKHHRQQQKWLCICIREVLARSRLVRLPQHEISVDLPDTGQPLHIPLPVVVNKQVKTGVISTAAL